MKHDTATPSRAGLSSLYAIGLLASACGGGRELSTGAAEQASNQHSAVNGPLTPTVERGAFDAAGRASRAEGAEAGGAAWRVVEVPNAGSLSLLASPGGWFALSNRSLGDSKAPSALESALYRSGNGVEWDSVSLDPGHDDLTLRDIAFGGGHYVMVGRRGFGRGVVWHSTDGERWAEASQPVASSDLWGHVTYAGGKFFALGMRQLGIAETGERWTVVPITTLQAQAVAYGDGRYLLVGSGPMQLSSNGVTWSERPLDCALPGACIADPDGGVHQHIHYSALFVDGLFYTDQLSTADGAAWAPLPDRFPVSYVAGHFLGAVQEELRLDAWTAEGVPTSVALTRPAQAAQSLAGRGLGKVGWLDRDLPLPERVDAAFEDGLTCLQAACVVVANRLLLVPPPDAAPLPDHVPRDAEGRPLLSDECPVSAMLTCGDYDARSGCFCNPEAPATPEGCQDVSQFRCAGALSARQGEWSLEEIAHAGCDCEGVDEAQPPSLGSACQLDGDACVAPP